MGAIKSRLGELPDPFGARQKKLGFKQPLGLLHLAFSGAPKRAVKLHKGSRWAQFDEISMPARIGPLSVPPHKNLGDPGGPARAGKSTRCALSREEPCSRSPKLSLIIEFSSEFPLPIPNLPTFGDPQPYGASPRAMASAFPTACKLWLPSPSASAPPYSVPWCRDSRSATVRL